MASFVCECAAGFEGDVCEVDIDECAGDPCQNGGTCTDGVASFVCECTAGFEGAVCELDVDECALGTATCDQHATCTNTFGGFECACKLGSSGDGQSCVVVNACVLTDNGGCEQRCVGTSPQGTASCACYPGFDLAADGYACEPWEALIFVNTAFDGALGLSAPGGASGQGIFADVPEGQGEALRFLWRPEDLESTPVSLWDGLTSHAVAQSPALRFVMTPSPVKRVLDYVQDEVSGAWSFVASSAPLAPGEVAQGYVFTAEVAPEACALYGLAEGCEGSYRLCAPPSPWGSGQDWTLPVKMVGDEVPEGWNELRCGWRLSLSSEGELRLASMDQGGAYAPAFHYQVYASTGADDAFEGLVSIQSPHLKDHSHAGPSKPTTYWRIERAWCVDGKYCGAHAECGTTEGGEPGCVCLDGFEGDGLAGCTDIDECALGTAGCDSSATCTNTEGGFVCACPADVVATDGLCTTEDACAASPNGGCAHRCVGTLPGGQAECGCFPGFDLDEADFTSCLPWAKVHLINPSLGASLDLFGPAPLPSPGTEPALPEGSLGGPCAAGGACDDGLTCDGGNICTDGTVVPKWEQSTWTSDPAQVMPRFLFRPQPATSPVVKFFPLFSVDQGYLFPLSPGEGGLFSIAESPFKVRDSYLPVSPEDPDGPKDWVTELVELGPDEPPVTFTFTMTLQANQCASRGLSPGCAGDYRLCAPAEGEDWTLALRGESPEASEAWEGLRCMWSVHTQADGGIVLARPRAHETCLDNVCTPKDQLGPTPTIRRAAYSLETRLYDPALQNASWDGQDYSYKQSQGWSAPFWQIQRGTWCTAALEQCGANSACVESAEGVSLCECLEGYTGDAVAGCTDIDECALEQGPCDPLAACTNTSGGFVCECPLGTTGDGLACEMEDACTFEPYGPNGGCGHICEGTAPDGSALCACFPGFDLSPSDGATCTPWPSVLLENTAMHTALSLVAPDGDEGYWNPLDPTYNYSPQTTWSDLAPSENAAPRFSWRPVSSDKLVQVMHGDAYYYPSAPALRFEMTPYLFKNVLRFISGWTVVTEAIDATDPPTAFTFTATLEESECATYTLEPGCAGEYRLCRTTPDYHRWTLPYRKTEADTPGGWDEGECAWVLRLAAEGEVQLVPFAEVAHAKCHPTDGCWDYFTPGQLDTWVDDNFVGNLTSPGFETWSEADETSGPGWSKPATTFLSQEGLLDTDLNSPTTLWRITPGACTPHNGLCGENAECSEEAECLCLEGYEGDPLAGCQDLDECALSSPPCSAGALCTNTVGGFECACEPGFKDDGSSCVDVDECQLGAHDCGPHAACKNLPGGYYCACEPGFQGDGYTCLDVDECAAGLDACDEDALCINGPGDYSCLCPAGMTGDGMTCTPAAACEVDNGACQQRCEGAMVGAPTCSCEPGFELQADGVSCLLPHASRLYHVAEEGYLDFTHLPPSVSEPFSFVSTPPEGFDDGYIGRAISLWQVEGTHDVFHLELAEYEGPCADGSVNAECPLYYRVCVDLSEGGAWRAESETFLSGQSAGWDSPQCRWRILELGEGTLLLESAIDAPYWEGVPRVLSCDTPSTCRLTTDLGDPRARFIIDRDDCAAGTAGCAFGATCEDSSPAGQNCTCMPPYVGDGQSCTANPCEYQNGGCSQLCAGIAEDGSALCDCQPGFALGDDGASCVAEAGLHLCQVTGGRCLDQAGLMTADDTWTPLGAPVVLSGHPAEPGAIAIQVDHTFEGWGYCGGVTESCVRPVSLCASADGAMSASLEDLQGLLPTRCAWRVEAQPEGTLRLKNLWHQTDPMFTAGDTPTPGFLRCLPEATEAGHCSFVSPDGPNEHTHFELIAPTYPCQGDAPLCASGALCHDVASQPGFVCACPPGFEGDPSELAGPGCTLIPGSCEVDPSPCDQNAYCETVDADTGAYTCTCWPPYEGDGYTTCQLPPGSGTCNAAGGAVNQGCEHFCYGTCSCLHGFRLAADGKSCEREPFTTLRHDTSGLFLGLSDDTPRVFTWREEAQHVPLQPVGWPEGSELLVTDDFVTMSIVASAPEGPCADGSVGLGCPSTYKLCVDATASPPSLITLEQNALTGTPEGWFEPMCEWHVFKHDALTNEPLLTATQTAMATQHGVALRNRALEVDALYSATAHPAYQTPRLTCDAESGELTCQADAQAQGELPPAEGLFVLGVDECQGGTAVCDPNATCVDLLEGYRCTCDEGFVETGDYLTPWDWVNSPKCAPYDACAEADHGCAQRCVGTSEGLEPLCGCFSGFVLAEDGTTCVAAGPLRLWTADDSALMVFQYYENWWKPGDPASWQIKSLEPHHCKEERCGQPAEVEPTPFDPARVFVTFTRDDPSCAESEAPCNLLHRFRLCQDGAKHWLPESPEPPANWSDESCAWFVTPTSSDASTWTSAGERVHLSVGPEYNAIGAECDHQWCSLALHVYATDIVFALDECAAGTADCGPNARCQDTQGGFECQCLEGFEREGDLCVQVDFCVTENGGCAQLCQTLDDAPACECYPGFELQPDGVSCLGKDHQHLYHEARSSFVVPDGVSTESGYILGAPTLAQSGAWPLRLVEGHAPQTVLLAYDVSPEASLCEPGDTHPFKVCEGTYILCNEGFTSLSSGEPRLQWEGVGTGLPGGESFGEALGADYESGACSWIIEPAADGQFRLQSYPHATYWDDYLGSNKGLDAFRLACHGEEASCRWSLDTADPATLFRIDADECALGTDPCDDNASCANGGQGAVCTCDEGYEGDGLNCALSNGCVVNNGGCPQLCMSDDEANVTCACAPGFEAASEDGTACVEREGLRLRGVDGAWLASQAIWGEVPAIYPEARFSPFMEQADQVRLLGVSQPEGPPRYAIAVQPDALEGAYLCASSTAGWETRPVVRFLEPGAIIDQCLWRMLPNQNGAHFALESPWAKAFIETQYPLHPRRIFLDWDMGQVRLSTTPKDFALSADACLTGQYSCPDQSFCVAGADDLAYSCECHAGYAWTGEETCALIDQCQDGQNGGCEQTCQPGLPGEVVCGCSLGYHIDPEGEGTTCALSNACLDGQNAGCEQLCVPDLVQPGVRTCGCLTGYYLDPQGDGTTCITSDACASENGGCEQICSASGPSIVTCGCVSGFELAADGQSCTQVEEGAEWLIPSQESAQALVPPSGVRVKLRHISSERYLGLDKLCRTRDESFAAPTPEGFDYCARDGDPELGEVLGYTTCGWSGSGNEMSPQSDAGSYPLELITAKDHVFSYGHHCGSCAEGQVCAIDPQDNAWPTGVCVPAAECTPSCEGKACGDDGCGGTCGTCNSASFCSGGACHPACYETALVAGELQRIYPAWPTGLSRRGGDVMMAPALPFVDAEYPKLLAPPSYTFTLYDRPGRCADDETQERSDACVERYRLCKDPAYGAATTWVSEYDQPASFFDGRSCAWQLAAHDLGAEGEVALTNVEDIREDFHQKASYTTDYPGEGDAPWMCIDGEDNDGDGRVDCGDLECLQTVLCAAERDFGLAYEEVFGLYTGASNKESTRWQLELSCPADAKCSPHRACTATPGNDASTLIDGIWSDPRYLCAEACPQGLRPHGPFACVDIDECTEDPDICGGTQAATCRNVHASFRCECKEGYARDILAGEVMCTPADACSYFNAGCEDHCTTDVEGTALCSCLFDGTANVAGQLTSGLKGDGKTCDRSDPWSFQRAEPLEGSNAQPFLGRAREIVALDACPAGQIRDCTNTYCTTEGLLHNGQCEPELACANYDFDGGDCGPQAQSTPKPEPLQVFPVSTAYQGEGQLFISDVTPATLTGVNTRGYWIAQAGLPPEFLCVRGNGWGNAWSLEFRSDQNQWQCLWHFDFLDEGAEEGETRFRLVHYPSHADAWGEKRYMNCDTELCQLVDSPDDAEVFTARTWDSFTQEQYGRCNDATQCPERPCQVADCRPIVEGFDLKGCHYEPILGGSCTSYSNEAGLCVSGVCEAGLSNALDFDGDGLLDPVDPCPFVADDDLDAEDLDTDGDGLPDACDLCPEIPLAEGQSAHPDVDGDGAGDDCDLCPETFNPDPNKAQSDIDGDGVGDICDLEGLSALCAQSLYDNSCPQSLKVTDSEGADDAYPFNCGVEGAEGFEQEVCAEPCLQGRMFVLEQALEFPMTQLTPAITGPILGDAEVFLRELSRFPSAWAGHYPECESDEACANPDLWADYGAAPSGVTCAPAGALGQRCLPKVRADWHARLKSASDALSCASLDAYEFQQTSLKPDVYLVKTPEGTFSAGPGALQDHFKTSGPVYLIARQKPEDCETRLQSRSVKLFKVENHFEFPVTFWVGRPSAPTERMWWTLLPGEEISFNAHGDVEIYVTTLEHKIAADRLPDHSAPKHWQGSADKGYRPDKVDQGTTAGATFVYPILSYYDPKNPEHAKFIVSQRTGSAQKALDVMRYPNYFKLGIPLGAQTNGMAELTMYNHGELQCLCDWAEPECKDDWDDYRTGLKIATIVAQAVLAAAGGLEETSNNKVPTHWQEFAIEQGVDLYFDYAETKAMGADWSFGACDGLDEGEAPSAWCQDLLTDVNEAIVSTAGALVDAICDPLCDAQSACLAPDGAGRVEARFLCMALCEGGALGTPLEVLESVTQCQEGTVCSDENFSWVSGCVAP
ncbi:MAG: EGF domain-containing protein [Myxococcota bacterium]